MAFSVILVILLAGDEANEPAVVKFCPFAVITIDVGFKTPALFFLNIGDAEVKIIVLAFEPTTPSLAFAKL